MIIIIIKKIIILITTIRIFKKSSKISPDIHFKDPSCS